MARAAACLLFVALSVASAVELGPAGGNWLSATYGAWRKYPTTIEMAKSSNWTQLSDKCDVANHGTVWGRVFEGSTDPKPGSPIRLHFTAAGQISGVSVYVFGPQWKGPVDQGYWKPSEFLYQGSPVHTMTVVSREASVMCTPDTQAELLGTQLVINQGAAKGEKSIPMVFSDAIEQGWDKYGSCFTGMGIHSSFSMTNKTEQKNNMFDGRSGDDLLPVVAMYDASAAQSDGTMKPRHLTSIFFFATVQNTNTSYDGKGKFFDGPPPHGQGPAGLCNNWCAGSGTFTEGLTMTEGKGFCDYEGGEKLDWYDTFHWQFEDPSNIQCARTRDVICGASAHLPSSNRASFPVGLPNGKTVIVDSQCCYPSMAPGLTSPHAPKNSCEANPECKKAGLSGQCCPNNNGTTLDCCAMRCSAHASCIGHTGDCCPTADGVMLDCCK